MNLRVAIENARVWPKGATLLDMHRFNGHRSTVRCRIAVALYGLSRWVSHVADKVGCSR